MTWFLAIFVLGMAAGYGLALFWEGEVRQKVWKVRCPQCRNVIESEVIGWYECPCGWAGDLP